MRSNKYELEKPVIGYIVIALALLTGMITVSAFGQRQRAQSTSARNMGLDQDGFLIERERPDAGEAPLDRRWILGVRADITATGFVIRGVAADSPASRIGLEPGDRIVAVDGQQIGLLGRRIVPLTKQLQQLGGDDGRVRLLVQDRRNRNLVSLDACLRQNLDLLGH
ncbi:MAG: PDZ domain-containing protein [Pirellulaceae bacterium]|nr:PDZ domain-containing protein [Pirellulaceae bacterium]